MVEARRIGVDSGNELPRTYCYTDCSVVVAPADLPDGDYTVYFDGHSFLATRLRTHGSPLVHVANFLEPRRISLSVRFVLRIFYPAMLKAFDPNHCIICPS